MELFRFSAKAEKDWSNFVQEWAGLVKFNGGAVEYGQNCWLKILGVVRIPLGVDGISLECARNRSEVLVGVEGFDQTFSRSMCNWLKFLWEWEELLQSLCRRRQLLKTLLRSIIFGVKTIDMLILVIALISCHFI